MKISYPLLLPDIGNYSIAEHNNYAITCLIIDSVSVKRTESIAGYDLFTRSSGMCVARSSFQRTHTITVESDTACTHTSYILRNSLQEPCVL